MSVAGIWLRAFFPCCKGAARLRAIEGVPVETYARTCRICKARWHIRRSPVTLPGGMRGDMLEWECVRGMPPCMRAMGAQCAAHGRGAPAESPCSATE